MKHFAGGPPQFVSVRLFRQQSKNPLLEEETLGLLVASHEVLLQYLLSCAFHYLLEFAVLSLLFSAPLEQHDFLFSVICEVSNDFILFFVADLIGSVMSEPLPLLEPSPFLA